MEIDRPRGTFGLGGRRMAASDCLGAADPGRPGAQAGPSAADGGEPVGFLAGETG